MTDQMRPFYDAARAIYPLLPAWYEYTTEDAPDPECRGLDAGGLPIFNVPPGTTLAPDQGAHEAGHAYFAELNRADPTHDLLTAYWLFRGFPGTWNDALIESKATTGYGAWQLDPRESWAEAFARSVVTTYTERALTYGKDMDPLLLRAFFTSIAPSISTPTQITQLAVAPAVVPVAVPTTMYDSTNPNDIPVDARMVAGYIDGWYRWPDDSWDRFPYARKIRIAIHAASDADVLDVEWGAADPPSVPAWVARQRAVGADPVVYVNRANWQACKDACDAAGIAHPKWWVAAYGIGATLLDGTVGTQYANEAITGHHYDLSIVAPEWAMEEDVFTREEFNRWFREQQVAEITPTIVAMKEAYDPLIAAARANGLVDATQEAHLAALDTRLAKLREV